MTGPWERIEGSSHDDELDAGVEARIADPLWMLARQWQTGEFRGDDAGSPVSTKVRWTARPVVSFQPGKDGRVMPIGASNPLERDVEAAPAPTTGSAALHWASRLATHLMRRLVRAGQREAIAELQSAFALTANSTVSLPGSGEQAVELLTRRGVDGTAVLAAAEPEVRSALDALSPTALEGALEVITAWQIDTNKRFAVPEVDTWDDHRLEHTFSIAAGTGNDEVILSAREYTGGHLDWYSFDIEPKASHDRLVDTDDGGTVTNEVTAIPTPVRYSGMPAARWWQFEEGDVHFGDIAAEAPDLSKLLLADYATVYSNDWFSVPVRLPLGTLSQVDRVDVFDTMGGSTFVEPAAIVDTRLPGQRSFRLYELTGDQSIADGKSPFLFLPPTLAGSEVGPAVETVEFIRDEGANLAWAIERHVEGPTGRAVDRLQHWRMSKPAPSVGDNDSGGAGPGEKEPGGAGPGEKEPGGRNQVMRRAGREPGKLPGGRDPDGRDPDDLELDALELDALELDAWRYRLESSAPPFWIPFVPTRHGRRRGQVRLRRARMQEWEVAPDPTLVGLKGELLQPAQPMLIEEEEVPRGGVTLERRWQTARWSDGSLHTWRQRSKRLGYGERSSGVRWDLLEELDTE